MENSKIEWTDHTFNPWIGCTKVSDGCKHCYAETLMDKRYGRVQWGPQGKRIRTSAANWKKPLKWNREAAAAGQRARVFCASLADVFEDKPEVYTWREELFGLICDTPHLDWLLLTKRPENVDDMFSEIVAPVRLGWEDFPNIWIGTSVENQKQADKRIPALLRIPAAVRFLSMEPLLGPVYLTSLMNDGLCSLGTGYVNCLKGFCFDASYDGYYDIGDRVNKINWVIVGGESGVDARPMDVEWARSIRDQCREAGVPFFMKQMDKKKQIPGDLFIREFPNG